MMLLSLNTGIALSLTALVSCCITEKLLCIAKRELQIASRSIVRSYLFGKGFLCLTVMASLTRCLMMLFLSDQGWTLRPVGSPMRLDFIQWRLTFHA